MCVEPVACTHVNDKAAPSPIVKGYAGCQGRRTRCRLNETRTAEQVLVNNEAFGVAPSPLSLQVLSALSPFQILYSKGSLRIFIQCLGYNEIISHKQSGTKYIPILQ